MLINLPLVKIYLVEGHSVDMPVSNPFLTDKLIDEELKQMMDMQVSEKRRGCVPSKLYSSSRIARSRTSNSWHKIRD